MERLPAAGIAQRSPAAFENGGHAALARSIPATAVRLVGGDSFIFQFFDAPGVLRGTGTSRVRPAAGRVACQRIAIPVRRHSSASGPNFRDGSARGGSGDLGGDADDRGRFAYAAT